VGQNFRIVVEGPRDDLGRAQFTMTWEDPDGVFRPELGKDGQPVGYRRGQVFRAVPEDYAAKHGCTVEEA
jgi:hypothetical protein